MHDTIPNNEAKFYDLLYNKTNPINQVSVYYRQAPSSRNSSYPYISGDTFRAFADYVYDETRQDRLNLVKYGEIIFVKTDHLVMFFNSPFDSIKNPFVLVTHNSDASAPAIYESYLLNPKILIWYASNPSVRNRAKLSPIPIGLANAYWPHGSLSKFTFALRNHRKPWSQRTNLLYVNFDVANNKAQRAKALLQASKIGNTQIIKQRIALETYLEHIGNVKFVLSPPGGGTDCHRTWEALYMGAVPIVLTSELDPLFSKTRSVIVNDWSQLTQDFLLSFNFSLNDHIIPDVLNARYWRKTLFRHRHNYSSVSS
ncbi:unnamed protein product [Rotaria magnacalcarata]|uniref:Exostosin GT47 domain-containing protein n=2 Tax=Rotaria magnacalcarata TaxID=392030 RepID=A0A815GTW7_9BILA|nr:unnamed protein product [Rotaria magnacalcarata]CAF1681595.1 unnamed protein product [Rotaria magnacalcarata]CAF2073235.1 unnamed protein product [Rotaria magnacalcarata]CAF3846050.1 unnamed protein product [Rotaria magnacalcarata]CAF4050509.1 unnamed protein product [Rotaria magnacalcarata]